MNLFIFMYKNSIEYYLINIGKYLHVKLKNNNKSLDSIISVMVSQNVYIKARNFYGNLCSVPKAYKCLSGSTIS